MADQARGVRELDSTAMWTFSVERHHEAAVVFLGGELDISCSAEAGSMLLAELGRTERLIADLDRLRFLDATTITELVRVHRTARQAGRSFTIRRPRRLVSRILRTTGTLELLSQDPG
jgi:anti-anti-sigma factor